MNSNAMSHNKEMALNLSTSLIAFAINLIISFFISPYIIRKIGVDANGFINLAHTFISYATLVTVALNSMSGRYITIALQQKKYELANKYYNAVFIGNLIISILLLGPAIFCLIQLENIINIPEHLIYDVKILFIIVFLNFFIGTILPNWHVAMFSTNKIYLNSIYSLKANILKIILIFLLFLFFNTKVYYIAIATLICSIYCRYWEYYYYRKLMPTLKVDYHYFEIRYIKELVASGIWNTINKAGHILLSGLDLLIANLFVGPVEMGLLSVAKTIPNTINSLSVNITNVFMPQLTIHYAHNDQKAIQTTMKQAMKISGVLLTIPLVILIVYGEEFYQLWLPSENAYILQILSVLTCFGLVFLSGIQPLFNVFTVTNKVKTNSLLLLLSGGISTLIVFILLKTTNLGVFAIAAVSTFINLVRNIVYTIPFTAKYLNLKWYVFFPEVLTSMISVIILSFVGIFIKQFIIIDSWIILIIICLTTSIIGLLLNMLIILNREERKQILYIFASKLKKTTLFKSSIYEK
ncbi:MAG: lipopolysaccharide biosynthesis protein [Turicibacter sp.]|nr:lipopolysaccharide biosynthesis protein [Turicibacter sp.]